MDFLNLANLFLTAVNTQGKFFGGGNWGKWGKWGLLSIKIFTTTNLRFF